VLVIGGSLVELTEQDHARARRACRNDSEVDVEPLRGRSALAAAEPLERVDGIARRLVDEHAHADYPRAGQKPGSREPELQSPGAALQRAKSSVVSCTRTPVPSLPPECPGDHAADCDKENRQQPGVNQSLERQGWLFCRHSLYHASLGCVAFHRIDSAFRGLAASSVQDFSFTILDFTLRSLPNQVCRFLKISFSSSMEFLNSRIWLFGHFFYFSILLYSNCCSDG
jgi:hypothetical protein